MVMTPDWESVGCEFDTGIFSFLREKPGLIRLILNTKSEKHECLSFGFGYELLTVQKFFCFIEQDVNFYIFSL